MKHSIIIPHRNRGDHLRACLWSIERSAQATGVTDYEVCCPDSGDTTFNKSASLNIGIDCTRGDFVTFLDADAIVGSRWLESVPFGDHITRCCYRVRYLDHGDWRDDVTALAEWYAKHDDDQPLAFEAYGSPDHSPVGGAARQGMSQDEFDPDGPWQLEPTRDNPLIFGNSQYTISREALGDLRFDDEYIGRGFEDLDMIWSIYLKHGRRYKGVIWTDADHAMFHLTHSYSEEWDSPALLAANLARYKVKREEYRAQAERIRL